MGLGFGRRHGQREREGEGEDIQKGDRRVVIITGKSTPMGQPLNHIMPPSTAYCTIVNAATTLRGTFALVHVDGCRCCWCCWCCVCCVCCWCCLVMVLVLLVMVLVMVLLALSLPLALA